VNALPTWSGRHNRRRRVIQLGFLVVFFVLPLANGFRWDLETLRLHVAGQEIWLDEWALLWLGLMVAMWAIAAVSLVLGRVYCAYACPQMIFSELAHDADAVARRLTNRFAARMPPARRARVERVAALTLVGALSLVSTVFFMAYFAPLPEVLARLARLDATPWIGAIGVVTTVLAFLDLSLVRERFCQSVCPYGLLQGVIEDGRSLHVAFDESTGPCIGCRACEKTCPMAIDIREGSFQMECTRCGACVDACEKVLSRRHRPSLLSFRLGVGAGTWDVKRVLVLVSTVAFSVAFAVAIARRAPVAFQLSPVYADSASRGPGAPESRFLLRAANRGGEPVTLRVRAEGLPPDAVVEGLADGVVAGGTERRFDLVVRVPGSELRSSVTPFVWIVETPRRVERFPSSFYTGGKTS